VASDGRRRTEKIDGATTYVHQLKAFDEATRNRSANLTPPADSVLTMGVIDDIYRAAGLPIRE